MQIQTNLNSRKPCFPCFVLWNFERLPDQSRGQRCRGGHHGKSDWRARSDTLPVTTARIADIMSSRTMGAHSPCGSHRRRKSESSYTKLLCSLFTCLWGSSSLSTLSSISLNKFLWLESRGFSAKPKQRLYWPGTRGISWIESVPESGMILRSRRLSPPLETSPSNSF